MDEFDRATEIEEAEREACVARAMNKPGMQPTGCCRNCGAKLENDWLFCPGGECRDDFEKQQRMKRIRGKA